MPRDISRADVAESIVSGIKSAYKKYYKFSNGCWLDHAPEYFVTCSIAAQLCSMDGNEFITLEHNVKDAIDCAGAISRGRLHNDMRHNGRSDIVLWFGNENPKALIEVKSPLYSLTEEAAKDITRIEQVLQKNKESNSFKYGAFAFYTSARDTQRSKAVDVLGDYSGRTKTGRIDTILTNIRDNLKNCKCEVYYSKSKTIEDSAWMAVCVLIIPC